MSTSPHLVTIETSRSVREIERDFAEIAGRHHLGLMAVHNLRQQLKDKGLDLGRECVVFEVCSAKQALAILDHRMEISTAIPCRVSVYEMGNRTIINLLRPMSVLSLFNAPGLLPMAEKFQENILATVEDIATPPA